MITIRDKYTGETYKCYQSSNKFATKDSFCTDGITSRWFRNWYMIIEYQIPLSTHGNKTSYQILLKDRFEVVL